MATCRMDGRAEGLAAQQSDTSCRIAFGQVSGSGLRYPSATCRQSKGHAGLSGWWKAHRALQEVL